MIAVEVGQESCDAESDVDGDADLAGAKFGINLG